MPPFLHPWWITSSDQGKMNMWFLSNIGKNTTDHVFFYIDFVIAHSSSSSMESRLEFYLFASNHGFPLNVYFLASLSMSKNRNFCHDFILKWVKKYSWNSWVWKSSIFAVFHIHWCCFKRCCLQQLWVIFLLSSLVRSNLCLRWDKGCMQPPFQNICRIWMLLTCKNFHDLLSDGHHWQPPPTPPSKNPISDD